MKASQKAYVESRLVEIARNHTKAIEAEHTIPAKELTNIEKVVLIRSGEVKLVSDAEIKSKGRAWDGIISLYDAYDFTKYETPAKLKNVKECRERVELMKKDMRDILDKVVLVDGTDAKALIDEFEATQY